MDSAKLHVLVDATAARSDEGGLLTYLEGLARGWQERDTGARFTFVGTSSLAPSLVALRECGFRVIQLPFSRVHLRPLIQQLLLPALARRAGADIMFGTAHVCPVAPVRVPSVVTMLDFRFLHRPGDFGIARNLYRRTMYRLAAKRAASIICISNATRREVIAQCREAEEKSRVIYLGGDHVLDWTKPRSPGDYAITFAGSSHKNALTAVRAWGALRRQMPDLRMRLVAVGASQRDSVLLSEESVRSGVSDLVCVYGHRDARQFQTIFAGASLLVFPSLFEGFGLPVLEAMMLKIPVVCSDIPALREVGAECVLYANALSASTVTEQCHRLMKDVALRCRLVEDAYERARSFTWGRVAEETTRVLRDTAHRER
jgi:glycosyltransferase involved in cell wall biosynthesis